MLDPHLLEFMEFGQLPTTFDDGSVGCVESPADISPLKRPSVNAICNFILDKWKRRRILPCDPDRFTGKDSLVRLSFEFGVPTPLQLFILIGVELTLGARNKRREIDLDLPIVVRN